ncbi:PREDICTED: uncharacterized protein LOC106811252 [Priapulus caudatus]|uniref:Uncharacterized protein LOC106811252 n=1 Tax=Priapulus caudatus TaxID=37621 RepID=A0ABM1EDM4_PRICU|nr:PREDICTED: uncharacterized protein LOC106811252 [Priapulus caudatus]
MATSYKQQFSLGVRCFHNGPQKQIDFTPITHAQSVVCKDVAETPVSTPVASPEQQRKFDLLSQCEQFTSLPSTQNNGKDDADTTQAPVAGIRRDNHVKDFTWKPRYSYQLSSKDDHRDATYDLDDSGIWFSARSSSDECLNDEKVAPPPAPTPPKSTKLTMKRRVLRRTVVSKSGKEETNITVMPVEVSHSGKRSPKIDHLVALFKESTEHFELSSKSLYEITNGISLSPRSLPKNAATA